MFTMLIIIVTYFSRWSSEYSEIGTFPVSEKAIREMPAGIWRFPFLIFLLGKSSPSNER
jgi:hypothetical protein